MKLISSFISNIQTGKGLLLFILGLIVVWLSGYYLIDFISSDERTRYSRQLYFSRITLALALLCLIDASLPHFRNFTKNTKKTATDLAVFRILFFGFFALGLIFNPSAISNQVQPFLDLPDSAKVALPFMGWYPKVIPINYTIVSIASILFYISIFTSLFGFKTRWSIAIFTITLFYLFAIPNLYGKVNHNHHLIWFPAILAFSPCADRFSIDAYFRRRKNEVIHHSPMHYSLPFILIWILIGLIYFFPGFWKMWSHGLDWSLTDNVRNQMYYKWFQLGDAQSWMPFFRIDQYPFLYKSSGIFTIIFELSFIPLILNKSTRKLGVAMGILFHIGTYLFMHIFFVVLVWIYLSFVNWNKISFLRERGNMSSLKPSAGSFFIVKWIGVGLISSCVIFGIGKWYSWPFSVYPTFEGIVEEETNHLLYLGENESEKSIELNVTELHSEYTSPRYWNMEYNIIKGIENNQLDTSLLDKFISIYSEQSQKLKKVSVYIERESIIPEKRLDKKDILIYSRRCN
ncbi:MAG: HTTM domain-containing protein [Crocinitomicaceae bacterium]|nr:HTTM domain-containing protein [Crocinitomicaceae bacterium]